MWQFTARICVLCAGLWVALMACDAGGDTVVDSRNASAAPASDYWPLHADVGWTYTPASSYVLTGILTEFASSGGNPSESVTEEIYSGDPAMGGGLLASATFIATVGDFVGTSLDHTVLLTGGHEYFVGFRDVGQLQVNYTTNPDATFERHFGYDTDGNGGYGSSAGLPGDPNHAPILKFEGAMAPAPTTFISGLLLVLGLGGIKAWGPSKKAR
jgi:hypothetical protein